MLPNFLYSTYNFVWNHILFILFIISWSRFIGLVLLEEIIKTFNDFLTLVQQSQNDRETFLAYYQLQRVILNMLINGLILTIVCSLIVYAIPISILFVGIYHLAQRNHLELFI
jgi:hypothetical protein